MLALRVMLAAYGRRLAYSIPKQAPRLLCSPRYRSAGLLRDTSSGEDKPFDIRALAERMRVSERKVKEAIYLLSEEGLRAYQEGEQIPQSDAHVIAEIGLNRPLPPPRAPEEAADSPGAREPRGEHKHGKQSCAYEVTEKDMDDVDEVISTDDVYKMLLDLGKPRFGFSVERGTGSKLRIVASNGERFVIHQPESKGSHNLRSNSKLGSKSKALRGFIVENMSPGQAKCKLCKRWFDTFSKTPGAYANASCLGCCRE